MTAAVADFTGYATKYNQRCKDGRTILSDAFIENDGLVVPLVYQHGHEKVGDVLGHVRLEHVEDGVRCHAYFNETEDAQKAKEQVRHGDLKWLSIFANDLVERVRDRTTNLKDVLKGNIREVSLVLAGANPGAAIDHLAVEHSDGHTEVFTDLAHITTGLDIEVPGQNSLEHAAGDKSATDILDTLNDEQRDAVYYLLSEALTKGSMKHSDTDESSDELDEEGAEGQLDGDEDDESSETEPESETGDETEESDEDASEEGESAEGESEVTEANNETTEAGDAVQHDNTQEDNSMTHNVFDQSGKRSGATPVATLSHSDVRAIVEDAENNTGSLKKSLENFVKHTGISVDGTLQHGIENIEYLFPDAQLIENSPAFISRRMEWVDKVLSGVRKSPFSRIKTITADITPDEARARGYIKGNMKNEEFFALSKRETTPQTIYKKQKLDRDDVVDIVSLDVVAWLKAEMKVMLDEELAGAILVGDGRSAGDDDKIKEINIRPIASDAELYVTTVNVNLDDASSSIEELIDAAIDNRRYYKGTGQPTFYTTEATISKFLTVKDNFGRRIYSNLQEVAAALRVSDIVPVEVMERVPDLVGIMVNLADYTLGADRGGQATMFDDFDINYNKLLYLIETRCSGALTTPKAALVFRKKAASDVRLAQPTAPAFSSNVVTVPTVSGVTYKNADTNATLTTGSPVTLTEGQELRVVAVAAAGKYFDNNAQDEWTYVYQS